MAEELITRWVIRIKIIKLIWLNNIVEKIQQKHNVTITEVEEFFQNKPKFRRGSKGNHVKENIYYAFGRNNTNRLLFVVFIFKRNNEALILSAREMDNKEKSVYSKL
ncbi:MAG: BrnT family toxin [ANME-2 cluster archaeon]|nr:BrnT family toxin [ANME-2 cluster archaeon]